LSVTEHSWDDRARVCDGWKKRPKSWNIYSEGTDNWPYWVDPYIPRATQKRLRGEKPDEERRTK
jgi:hypothetical protein